MSEYINPGAFQAQAPGTFGNVGRDSLNGPGSWNIDTSFSRLFKFTERWNLETRADMFNLLNHGNWVLSGTTSAAFTSSTFGQITSFSSPRIIQLGMKLSF